MNYFQGYYEQIRLRTNPSVATDETILRENLGEIETRFVREVVQTIELPEFPADLRFEFDRAAVNYGVATIPVELVRALPRNGGERLFAFVSEVQEIFRRLGERKIPNLDEDPRTPLLARENAAARRRAALAESLPMFRGRAPECPVCSKGMLFESLSVRERIGGERFEAESFAFLCREDREFVRPPVVYRRAQREIAIRAVRRAPLSDDAIWYAGNLLNLDDAELPQPDAREGEEDDDRPVREFLLAKLDAAR